MAINKERAWETLKELSFERVTGTEEEKKAAELLKSFCEKAGVEAWLEEYEIAQNTIEKVELTVLGDHEETYTVIGVGGSGSTPDEGIVAPFVYIEDASDATLGYVRGKIAVISGMVNAKHARRLKELGAVGFVGVHGGLWDDPKLVQEPRPKDMRGKKSPEFPGVSMRIEDMEKLVRDHKGDQLRLVMKTTTKDVPAHNVVAVIPGTRMPEEEVVLTAHYDSVRWSSGAWDNATGSIAILEMLHHFLENKPERTVRFIWCGSEEIGLKGSEKYCEAHKDDLKKIIYNINFDMLGNTLGQRYFACSACEEALHAFQFLAKVRGQAFNSKLDLASSDSTSFAKAGVPSCTIGKGAPRGGAEIHNHHDVLDRLDADTLYRDIDFALEYVELITNAAVNPIPKEIAKPIKEKISEMAKRMAEMEGEEKKDEKEEKKDEEKK